MTLRSAILLSIATAVLAMFGAAGPAAAKTKAPRLTAVRCVPKTLKACTGGVKVTAGQKVQLSGQRLKRSMRVSFRWSKGALATKLSLDRVGWTARVPAGTPPGRVSITVTDRAGRRSNPKAVAVVAPAPVSKPSSGTSTGSGAGGSGAPGTLPPAFAGDGMWIWYLNQSEGGNLDAIAEQAKAAGMSTVFVKSADGANVWSQFSPGLVAALHQRGLKACAWQFVYGSDPEGEARAAAASVAAGADCFVIDAETQYEGRYPAAQQYMTALRAAIGPEYPLGLTSFPYVDFHPRLPYSVFLGPGGAQANLPQVYWKDIGTSVDAASAKTVANNRIYGVPVAPLGQTYGSPTGAELARFRAVWAGYGSTGLSWWSWQATPDAAWSALEQPALPAALVGDPGWPALAKGSKGDQVIRMQQLLASADPSLEIDGAFTAATAASLEAFQTARSLPATGETDAATWLALLTLPAKPVDW